MLIVPIASNVTLGKGVVVYQQDLVNLYGCSVGDETRIGAFVEIQQNASIGRRCKISSHSFICEGVDIDDEVFIGHGVVFTNDLYPRATTADGRLQTAADWQVLPTKVGRRASIGSNATILPNLAIGEGAIVGAGAVVTRDVPAHAVVQGVPARVVGDAREHLADPANARTAAAGGTDLRHVPQADLSLQWRQIEADVMPDLKALFTSSAYCLGPWVERFEQAFADRFNVAFAVGVNSGTSALHLAMIAADVGPGDEVLVPANTFVATAWAVRYVGATPVFCDVDQASWTIDVADVESRITQATKAVVPVHLYGQPADMSAIGAMAIRHGLCVVEDAAQAVGAQFGGRYLGGHGLLGCFSFYPSKNLGAAGEGGMVTTDDEMLAARLRRLRDHAQSERYVHGELGFNYRMEGIQALVLSHKLKHLERWTVEHRAIAKRYRDGLAGAPVELPAIVNGDHVWHSFVIHTPLRDPLREHLAKRGIETGLHYPVPLHRQPCFADLAMDRCSFPAADRNARECLSLPIFVGMSATQIDRVISEILAFFEMK
jgi:dTDP-4-amino-4,6-dideoxygalactose transaminase/acetyltransferase-like isoleucine patch superfamily enzyme